MTNPYTRRHIARPASHTRGYSMQSNALTGRILAALSGGHEVNKADICRAVGMSMHALNNWLYTATFEVPVYENDSGDKIGLLVI